jgi:DNA-binding transcriptional MerR regulator
MALLIHEAAKAAGVHRDTVRRAEKRGLISPVRDVNNWRRYHPDVVQRLRELYARESEDSDD